MQGWLRAAGATSTRGLTAPLRGRPGSGAPGPVRGRVLRRPAGTSMLAAISAARADVLLLDEPANHRDADGLERLRALRLPAPAGSCCRPRPGPAGAVCDRIVELDPHTGTASTWTGAWSPTSANAPARTATRSPSTTAPLAERTRLTRLGRTARERAAQVTPGAQRSRARQDLRRAVSAERPGLGLAGQLRRRAERVPAPGRPWRPKDAPPSSSSRWSFNGGVVAALERAVGAAASSSLVPSSSRSRRRPGAAGGAQWHGKSTVAALAGRLGRQRPCRDDRRPTRSAGADDAAGRRRAPRAGDPRGAA